MDPMAKTKTLNISANTHQVLKQAAVTYGMSMQEIAEAAISQYVMLLEAQTTGKAG